MSQDGAFNVERQSPVSSHSLFHGPLPSPTSYPPPPPVWRAPWAGGDPGVRGESPALVGEPAQQGGQDTGSGQGGLGAGGGGEHRDGGCLIFLDRHS